MLRLNLRSPRMARPPRGRGLDHDLRARTAASSGVGERSLIGYTFTCGKAGLWRGSVQALGPSLSHRLPAFRGVALIWPARAGRRSTELGEAQDGFAQLEVAVPSRLDNQ